MVKTRSVDKLTHLKYKTCLGCIPFSSKAPWPFWAAHVPTSLSEVEQEQRPSGYGDRGSEASVHTQHMPHHT